MYSDIGKKIKGWAVVMFAFSALVSVIIGALLIARDEDDLVIALIIMLGGTFSAWISSWLMYGFGEIVDKLCEIEKNTRSTAMIGAAPEKTVYVAAAPAAETPVIMSPGLRPPKAF